jgi:hypothetical protein
LRSIPEKERKRNLEPARKGLGEVVLRLDEACKGDDKKAIHDGESHLRPGTAVLLHLLFLQSLTCFLKKRVTIGLFEAAQ